MVSMMQTEQLSALPAMMSDMPPEPTSQRPLVGRADELRRLSELVGLVRPAAGPKPDRSGVVLLAGDAGVGKTRLLAELANTARARGWTVALGHCLDFGDSALPYLPFSEVVAVWSTSCRPRSSRRSCSPIRQWSGSSPAGGCFR